jgi:hypothetical protein
LGLQSPEKPLLSQFHEFPCSWSRYKTS